MTSEYGGPVTPPQNAPPSASPQIGVQPGVTPGIVRASVVIISGGPTTGLFVYNGTPALGNPPVLWAVPPGTTKDLYGNTLPGGSNIFGIGTPSGQGLSADSLGNLLLASSVSGSSISLKPNVNQSMSLTAALAGVLEAAEYYSTPDGSQTQQGVMSSVVLGSGTAAKMCTLVTSPYGTGGSGAGILLQAVNDGGTDLPWITIGTVKTSGGTLVFTPQAAYTTGAYVQYTGGGSVTVTTFTTTGANTWNAPAGVTSVSAACWGAGGGGSAGAILSFPAFSNQNYGGGGAGGGEYAITSGIAVTAGNNYTATVGTGGTGTSFGSGTDGGDSSFTGNVTTVTGHGGSGAPGAYKFAGAAGSFTTIRYLTPDNNGHSGNWTAPAGVTSVKVECWGAAGGGGAAGSGATAGGNGGNTTFAGNSVTVTAHGGTGGGAAVSGNGTGGAGGSGSTNGTHNSGGAGAAGAGSNAGGGGGGSAGPAATGITATTSQGAAAVAGGGPGAGWNVAFTLFQNNAVPGGGGNAGGSTFTGGGGGGGEFASEAALAVTPGNLYAWTIGTGGPGGSSSFSGGAGADGLIRLTYTLAAGSTTFAGGAGGAGDGTVLTSSQGGGGGGSSGGSSAAGNAGAAGSGLSGGAGGSAPAGGGSGGAGGTWAACVDIATEIFTRRGWLRYDQILPDDETMAIRLETGDPEWTLIERVNIHDGDWVMTEVTGPYLSACVNDEHRWLVCDAGDSWVYKHTSELDAEDRFPLDGQILVRYGNCTSRQVTITGIIWSPTTALGNWLARRDGTAYFTGNKP